MGVTDKLIFGNVDSSDYGVFLTGSGTFGAPERDVEYVSVPGRNGDLILDNGRWNNIEVTYPANIPYEFVDKFAAFRAAVCRQRGYQRLEDTYHPDEFRLAAFTEGFEPEPTPLNKGGEFDIVFNCKPQRFLKSGEEPIQYIPVIPGGPNSFSTQYLSGTTDTTVTLHCPEGVTIDVSCDLYSVDKEFQQRYTRSLQNDGVMNVFQMHGGYFRIVVNCPNELWDQVSLSIDTYRVHATLARTIKLTNPTGYPSKPLIEVKLPSLSSFTISNYVNGAQTEYYQMRVDNTGVNRFWIDCETEYVYDDNMNNLTDKLVITTAESAIGEGLVFPTLGEETIELYMYTVFAPEIDDGVVNIYPRWWTL